MNKYFRPKCARRFQQNSLFALLSSALLPILILVGAQASFPANAQEDLTELGLQELLSLDIASVARRPMKADEAPAAAFVITQEDIRETGAETIPELLKLVPGFEVAEVDNNFSAVTARGFNWRFSSKLLILIDGRAIYQPAFFGVLWDQQLVPVEEIERIEVLRGPGAALWGVNAVNGVINIVTKHAVDSLGGRLSFRYGTDDSGRAFARQGGKLGENAAFRLYATGKRDASLLSALGENITDNARGAQAGFRVDWEPSASDSFTFQGDVFDHRSEQALVFLDPQQPLPSQQNVPIEGAGVNVLGRWVRTLSDTSSVNVQIYYDHITRSEIDPQFSVELNTYSIEGSYYFDVTENNSLLLGGGYQRSENKYQSGSILQFAEPDLPDNRFFIFAHNDATFFDDHLTLSTGARLDHTDYTGWEFQPNIRALWRTDDNWNIWAAISRATRTPSLIELAIDVDFGGLAPGTPFNPGPLPVLLPVHGNEDLKSEPLIAFELGARKKWADGPTLDVALYAHDYNNLVDTVSAPLEFQFAPFGPGGALVPVAIVQRRMLENLTDISIYGVELSLEANLTDFWNVALTAEARRYSGLVHQPPNPFGAAGFSAVRSPRYQMGLRSNFTLTNDIDATIWVRHVGELVDVPVDAYTDLDVRVSWRPKRNFEITLLGENLTSAVRANANSLNFTRNLPGFIERKGSLQLSVRY